VAAANRTPRSHRYRTPWLQVRRYLYVPSGKSATLSIASLSRDGHLTALAHAPTARAARCVTTDQRGNAYVCDPRHGRLLVIPDRFGERRGQ